MSKIPTRPQYILAIEPNSPTLRKIVTALSRFMGSGRVIDVNPDEAFKYEGVNVSISKRAIPCSIILIA